jgi:hypothetical protein
MVIDRLLLSAEGDLAVGGGTAAAPDTPTSPPAGSPPPPAPVSAPAAWYAPAETLKTSDPEAWAAFEKSVQSGGSKDWPGVVKHVVSLEKKLGTAINLPGKDAKPEEIAALKTKLSQAGIIPAVPESPDKYEINLDSEIIPEAMRDEGTISSVRDWAFKHGVSNDAVKDLMAIEAARYSGVVAPALAYTNEQGMKAVEEIAASIGKSKNEVLAYAGSWLAKNFSEEEVMAMEKARFANSPTAIKYAVRAGLDTGEDISTIPTGPTADSDFDEAIKFTTDTNHPDYKLWISGDPQDPKRMALKERYDAAFKKKFGTGEAR